jgi:hypothetical protein
VATFASAVAQDLTAGASRHAIAKAMLLGPLTDIWLVRALHLFSESYERGPVHTSASDAEAVEEGRTRLR